MSLNREEETLAALGAYAGTRVELLRKTITIQSLAQAVLDFKDQQYTAGENPASSFFVEHLFGDQDDDVLDEAEEMLIAFARGGILFMRQNYERNPAGAIPTTLSFSLQPFPEDIGNHIPLAERLAYLEQVAQNGDITPPPLPQH